MDHKSKLRQIALCAMLAMGAAVTASAQTLPTGGSSDAVVSQPAATAALPSTSAEQATQAAQSAQQAPATTLNADEAKQSAAGNVAELQQMIRTSDLVELRTTYNGSYGASLLFYGKEMTYYVALFQQKNFWRVIKTSDETRAELIYKDFARQTVQLSDVELRRTLLEAQKVYTERMIALSKERANRLQADVDVARQQQTIVSSQQQSARAEATALAQQKAAAQDQLRETQRQVRALQKQLDVGLPTK
ncbi:DUF2968 domain-containing protein [Paraburkholderia sp.]|uniref:DUF2968 domain-containing protein n=1 Tax=Paraburkholderia sp. TaxID=1926495 RepID=UPI00239E6135|nr:DUF2968 domain-containing protein [Paraburkholderia sp.]MDE1184649.1 DUF2968 domain-containing protein [Paraburkholderia sp.]